MHDYDIRSKIGLRIKELRAERGVSQEEFASLIGMSRSYFGEVETGKRNVAAVNLEKITKGLGVSLAEFFDSEFFGER
ncbi:helix-turn-helix transcriptional regulator [Gordonibacter pamelaeae]|uniref:helix-turn-helix domain-containing protein n=1 Tax=Gordonibacter pamelaeae TaxID=471189 RepID=UPI002FE2F74B